MAKGRRTISYHHTYNFSDWDPVLDELLSMWRTSKMPLVELATISGVRTDTLKRWFRIGGRKPPHSPWHKNVAAVKRAMGYDSRDFQSDKLTSISAIRQGVRFKKVKWRGKVISFPRAA